MGKRIWTGVAALLAAFAASVALTAHAGPIDFGNAQYDTSAFAFSGTLADANSDATPTPLPLVSSATVAPDNDFATGSAVAAAGLLVATSEADSFTNSAGGSAGAQSHFVSTIVGSGRVVLNFDFQSLNSIAGGDGSGQLFILLTNTLGATTTTLFNGFFDATTNTTLQFAALGAFSTLDVTLFSSATTSGDAQSAQNFSQVLVSGVLPEPETLPLVLGGLVGVSLLARRSAKRGHGTSLAPA